MTNKFSGTFRTSVTLVAAAVLAGGCSQPQQQQSATAPVEVGVYTVTAQPLTMTTDLPGRTVAYRVAEVRPQVSGILQRRLFAEGSNVKHGEQLYQIDAASYEAQLKKARANLLAAERLAKRYETLRATNAISQQQYDDAIAAWRQAEADAEIARIDLVYTRVLAPISGRISRSAVSEGALVTNGQVQALATVQQLDPIYVDVTQSMTEILRLRKALEGGQLERVGENAAKAVLTLEDGSAYPLDGTLEFSEISVDQGTGSVVLRATFPNPEGKLLPGMFVHARLQTGVQQNAMLVPQQAVVRNTRGQPMTWVVAADGTVAQRPIETLRTVGNAWLVGSGLQPGEQVVTEGLQRLRSGARVQVAQAGNVELVTDLTAAPVADGRDS